MELEDRYLVDVGSGKGAVYPLRLDWPEPQEDPGGSFLIRDAPGGGDIEVVMDGVP